jgi:uncharacterized spore protein YtfJ
MADTEKIISETVEQIKSLLTSEQVVGQPIQIGEATILPLFSIGFGFGGGGGKEGAGDNGQGAGAGGGIKPIALVISDAKGIRVEPVRQASSSLIESVATIVERVMAQKSESGDT